jgi:hypothetical protein
MLVGWRRRATSLQIPRRSERDARC